MDRENAQMTIKEDTGGLGAPRSRGARPRMATGASACAVSLVAAVGLGVGLAGPAAAATTHRVVTGIVESVTTGSFTVKSGAATITVDVTSSTRYFDHGVSSPTIANVTIGERVKVRGREAGTNTVDASRVRVLQAVPIATGTVHSVTTSSFTITKGTATITVNVSSTTRYLDHGVSSPTAANVTTGEHVEVWGSAAGTNAVQASEVRVLPARPRRDLHLRAGQGVARLRSGVAPVSGTIARVPISCSLTSCRGTIRLSLREAVRVRHGSIFETRTEVLSLGSAAYSLRRHATADVTVHLDRTALVALGHATGHHLPVTVTVARDGAPLTSSHLVLAR